MKKSAGKIFLALLLVIALSNFVLAVDCSQTVTRSVPTTVAPGQSFQLTYTASSVSGNWGGTVQDTLISGGCNVGGKTSLMFAMLSDLPNPLVYIVTAPSSGSCTFTGDYKIGDCASHQFSSSIVTISGSCTPSCSGKTCGDNGCGGVCGTCSSDQTCSSGTCQSSGGTGGTGGADICSTLSKVNLFKMDDSCTGGGIAIAAIVIGLFLVVSLIKK